jgi:trigger factor
MRSEQDGQLQRNLNQSLDDYLANNNLSVDEFDERLRKSAEATVHNTLVLNALADRDEILYTQDDINAEIMNMAAAMRVNAQQLADSLDKNTEELANVVSRVRAKNTIKYLASRVSVVEYEENYSTAHSHDHNHGHEEEARPEPHEHAHDEGDAEQ